MLRAQQARTTRHEGRRAELLGAFAAKEQERERVMTLYQRGKAGLTLADVEKAPARLSAEKTVILTELDQIRAECDLADATEAQCHSAATLLAQFREQVAEIERTNDVGRKRRIFEALVAQVVVHTEGTGRAKWATVTVRYRFGADNDSTSSAGWSRTRRGSRRCWQKASG